MRRCNYILALSAVLLAAAVIGCENRPTPPSNGTQVDVDVKPGDARARN